MSGKFLIVLGRVGHHSTSDDSFAYRGRQEVEQFKKTDNPLHRMKRFLEQKDWWDEEKEAEIKDLMKKEVLDAFRRGESLSRNRLSELFGDIYSDGTDDLPWNLVGKCFEMNLRY
jgi:2-oxoisovalerate dehydrogenase E1 component alpha subunit